MVVVGDEALQSVRLLRGLKRVHRVADGGVDPRGRVLQHLEEFARADVGQTARAVGEHHRRDDVVRGRSQLARLAVEAVADAARPDAHRHGEVAPLHLVFKALDAPQRKLFALARRDVEHPLDFGVDRRVRLEFGLRGGRVRGALLFALLLFGLRLEFVVDRRFFGGHRRRLRRGLHAPDGRLLREHGLDRRLGGRLILVIVVGHAAHLGLMPRRARQRIFNIRLELFLRRAHAALFALGAPEKGQKHHGRRRDENEDGLVRHGRW